MPDFWADSPLCSLPDERLCALAKSDDAMAAAMLVARFTPLVQVCAKRYASYGGPEAEDLIQDGLIGLLHAIRRFDADKGASFSSFAYTCVDRSLITSVKRSLGRKKIPAANVASLDGPQWRCVRDCAPSPQILLEEKESARKLQLQLKSNLSALEYEVLVTYLSGRSYAQTAAQLGISPKTVDNALQRVRSKLR